MKYPIGLVSSQISNPLYLTPSVYIIESVKLSSQIDGVLLTHAIRCHDALLRFDLTIPVKTKVNKDN